MKTTERILAIAAAAALAAGTLAACGDDEDESSTSPEAEAALTSDELVTQANEVCAEHSKAIDDAFTTMFEETGNKPEAVDYRVLAKETVLPQYTAQIGTLDTFVPPEDLAADWDTWITDSYAVRDAIKDDPAVMTDASQFTGVNDEASALGLGEDCAAGPS